MIFNISTDGSFTYIHTTEGKSGISVYDQGIMSSEQLTTFYQYKAIGSVLCPLGILSSFLSILVNSSLKQDAYVTWIIGISLCDGMFLISVVTGVILNVFFPVSSQVYENYSLYVSSCVSIVFRRTAVVLNGLASSERFFKLIFPFTPSKTLLSRYPRWVILCVFVLCGFAHFPLALEFEAREVRPRVWMVVGTRLQQENYDTFLVLRNTGRAVFFYLPIVYSLCINLALVTALKLHASKLHNIRATPGKPTTLQTSAEKSSQIEIVMKTSRLVLILSFSFFLLALPSTLNATLGSFMPDYGFFSRNRYLSILLSHLAEWTVYTTQPCILTEWIVLSRKFRKSLLRTLHLTKSCGASLGQGYLKTSERFQL